MECNKAFMRGLLFSAVLAVGQGFTTRAFAQAGSAAIGELVSFEKGVDTGLYSERFSSDMKLLEFAATDMDDINKPWEMFTQAMTEQVAGTADWAGLQVLTTPMVADWNDPQYGDYYAWYKWGDQMPVWSPTYRATPRLITTAYSMIIGSIDVPDVSPELRRAVHRAAGKYTRAVTKYTRREEKIGPNWLEFERKQQSLPANRRKTFDQWYASNEAPHLLPLLENVQLTGQNYNVLLGRAYQGYQFAASAITEFDNPAYQLAALSPDGSRLSYRTYNISPGLTEFIAESKRMVAEGKPPEIKFSLDRHSSRRRVERTRFGGGGFFFGGFFGLFGGGSYYREKIDTSSEAFQMEVSVRNYRVFNISPGRWFNGQLLTFFKNGPWREGSAIDRYRKSGGEVWNKGGLFPLMPTQIVVGYQPRVKITLKQEDYHSMVEKIRAGGVLWIGPFGFGGGYSRSIEDVKFDSQTNTIIAEDSSETPKVMVVVSGVLPDFN